MSRRKKLLLNTAAAFILQIVTLVCGFILPRHILAYFGSGVNGLVTSVSRFLSAITFLELGLGPVVQSNLYRPLAEKDTDAISRIVVAAERFYRKVACIFLAYVGILLFVFPRFNSEFGFRYTAGLLFIISISTFAQYYFGITYQVFLNADQKAYVHSMVQTVTVVLNTVLSIVLMRLGCSIHMVKLMSTVVYILRPLVQNRYVHRHYRINRRIECGEEPIRQKWNGLAQHLAAIVCEEIDIVLLTFFSTYRNVSVYSVYMLVAGGMGRLVLTAASGLEALWGNMRAKGEDKRLCQTFEMAEVLTHMGACVIFMAMSVLIAPFVSVYVSGLEDAAAYYVPFFGALLSLAYGGRVLRIPYFTIVKAAGQYKETQNGAIISMMLNIVISVALVRPMGLVGVAAGTAVAMLYHTAYFAWHLRGHIIYRPFGFFVKHMAVDAAIGAVSYFLTRGIRMEAVSYPAWVLYAGKVTAVVLLVTVALNLFFYHREIAGLSKMLLQRKE